MATANENAPAAGGQGQEQGQGGSLLKSLMGMFRMMPDDRTSLYEFLVIEEDAGSVALRFLHYRRNLGPIDDKPLYLPLVSAGPTQAVFENPALETLRRITYRLMSPTKLRVQVDTVHDAKPTSLVLDFERVD